MTADSKGAVVPLDDLLGDPETESGSCDSLGGEEGLEDAAEGFGRDSGAGVRDGDGDARSS